MRWSWASVRRRYGWPAGCWLAGRLILVLTAWASLSLLPARQGPDLWDAYPGNDRVNGWLRWDAGWYAAIATDGYVSPEAIIPGEQRNTAFFPAYPLAVRGVAWLTGDVYAAGLLVSNLAFLLALLLLHDLVWQLHDEGVARATTAVLLCHPCSFYFSAMYSESLFLLWAVLAFRSARRRRWLAAGLWAALGGATRVVGIALVIALAVEYLAGLGWSFRRVRADVLGIAVGLLGPLAHLGFLARRYGSPFEFIAAQHSPGWTPWGSVIDLLPESPVGFLNLGFLAVAMALVALLWRIRPRSYAVWSTLMILLSITRGPSLARLSLVVFPIWVEAARRLRGRRWFPLVLVASGLLLLVLTARFALWYWVV